MLSVEPYSTPTRIPHIPTDAVWLNDESFDLQTALRGVVIFDFWDYTCINCLRTLPYLREWHARYRDLDFSLIGIHTPEFPFAREFDNVHRAVRRLGVRWPVVIDNDQSLWTSFANRYWPTKYLVDRRGYLRYRHSGEGEYQAFESAIQELLQEGQSDLDLPEILEPVRADDFPGAVCLPTTPELQIDSLGNPLPVNDVNSVFRLPAAMEANKFYLEGEWVAVSYGYQLKSESGSILLKFKSSRCNAVLAPPDEYNESSQAISEFITLEAKLDSSPLPPEYFGEDILLSGDRAVLRVDFPRMYTIAKLPSVEQHTLSLEIQGPGLVFYAFSFESCASVLHPQRTNAEG